ncbi:MAG: GNAT family N-acetyltransferase [candidate division Zixibacteria bacterium]|nr:GNAT family N-acetyltransferase [candidate division Zixibacteria bacterium]
MNIRKLTADDAAAFREIRVEMCERHPEAFGQTSEEVTAMPDDKCLEWWTPSDVFPEKFVLAAFEGDRIVGTAAFKREDSAKERHRGWIWSVYVRPEARGRRLSKQLMQQLIDEARKMEGLEILSLVVALTQTSARTLYTALGFFTTGLILHGYKLPDGRYIDHEEMMLWL